MSDFEYALTDEEERWIAALRRLAARRPKTLGVWGGEGDVLTVIALTEDGGLLHNVGGAEVVCAVTNVRIPAGGGDPDWINVEDFDRPWVRPGGA